MVLCVLSASLFACSSPQTIDLDGGFDASSQDVASVDVPGFDVVTHERDAGRQDGGPAVEGDAARPMSDAAIAMDGGAPTDGAGVMDSSLMDGGADMDAGSEFVDASADGALTGDGGSGDDAGPFDAGAGDTSMGMADADLPVDAGTDAPIDSGVVVPPGCADGTFDDDRNPVTACRPWSECESGEYVQQEGDASNDQVCAGCESGTYSVADNAESCIDWTDCARGSFVESEGSSTVDRRCAPCPEGRYSSGENQAQCIEDELCPAGTVQTQAGTPGSPARCEACVVGEYCIGAEVPRTTCAAPTWDHDADAATACAEWTECVAGTYVHEPGSPVGDRMCEVCAPGTFSGESNAEACRPWQVCGAGEVPTPGTASRDRECTPVMEM